MERRAFLGTLAAPLLQTPRNAAPPSKTNVVMIMTDDHGAWALGAYGCEEMHTPNLDKLAREGARFTRAYACTPVCSPSRMTWMTGRIPSVHGVQDWLVPDDSFQANTRSWLQGHPTYAEHFAKSGYTMGMCGKWHMGNDDKPQYGFTFWSTVPGGGGTYRNAEFVKNGKKGVLNEYKTDAVGDSALEFLDTVKQKPFYLLVPFYAPHTPFDYQPERYREPYKDAKFSCFPTPPVHAWQNRGLRNHHGNRESMRSYSALITGMDANVGRIVRKLEEMGVRENTLIVFSADQGWNAGHHGVWGKGNGTWPFNMYEESIRVPLIWNHPGRIKPGQVLTQMVSSYDYFPTITDYAGVKTPADAKRPGRSYAGLLRGEKQEWDNRRLYFEYSFVRGVRTETMKYIRRTKEWPSELYDLERDPGETANRVDDPQYRDVRAALDADLDQWFQRHGAPPQEEWRSTTKQRLSVYSR
ncbi:MAG: sulfatase-like hydrolase/transferase [Candidatus Solibacter usitatus]|nr:sulfatase-like hydrolase/transferase [Candidatus Solibacter usitatus]